VVGLARRQLRDRASRVAVEVSALGYALPGSVLAVGVMMSFASLDNALNTLWRLLGGGSLGPVLGGRSPRCCWPTWSASWRRERADRQRAGAAAPSVVEAARTLGARGLDLTRRIYLPLLRPGCSPRPCWSSSR